MREILFRGKRKDNGVWVEGYYGQFHNRPTVMEDNSHQIFVLMENATFFGSSIGGVWFKVAPETLGQYTGLTDKNGKKIYEGDILKVCRGEDIEIGYVIYDERMAAYSVSVTENDCLVFIDWFIAKQEDNRVWIEVIGNIHDNPELLKGGAEE